MKKKWKRSSIIAHLIWKCLSLKYDYKPLFCHVTFIVVNNRFSNDFKYPHGLKSQNSFGSMNMVFPLKLSYFFSKKHWKFVFFIIAREISKSNFFAIFCKWLYFKRNKPMEEWKVVNFLEAVVRRCSPKLLKNRNWTFLAVRYFTWKLKFLSNINLWRNEKLSIF